MSIRFAIKNTAAKADKEGDVIVRYSGVSEPFRRTSERTATKIGQDKEGNALLTFTTGLDTNQLDYFKWFTEDEKAEVRKQIEELTPIVTKFYGGTSVVDSGNKFFWGENRDVNRLSLSNETIDVFYDTKNPVHALLYLSVISGAFIDMVAPNRDWAEKYQLPHYLALDTDDATYDDEEDITRSDAHAALAELRKDANPEAMFILAWCIQYDTNAFGGINRATPLKNLINTHIQYIDGKLVSKKKRKTPQVFLEYAKKWNGAQTRPKLYAEAYIKAGEYFNFVNQKEKRFVTQDGTILGNTVTEAVESIMKAKHTQDLENLREKVEAKWQE